MRMKQAETKNPWSRSINSIITTNLLSWNRIFEWNSENPCRQIASVWNVPPILLVGKVYQTSVHVIKAFGRCFPSMPMTRKRRFFVDVSLDTEATMLVSRPVEAKLNGEPWDYVRMVWGEQPRKHDHVLYPGQSWVQNPSGLPLPWNVGTSKYLTTDPV